jgi:hypothetical protein
VPSFSQEGTSDLERRVTHLFDPRTKRRIKERQSCIPRGGGMSADMDIQDTSTKVGTSAYLAKPRTRTIKGHPFTYVYSVADKSMSLFAVRVRGSIE